MLVHRHDPFLPACASGGQRDTRGLHVNYTLLSWEPIQQCANFSELFSLACALLWAEAEVLPL